MNIISIFRSLLLIALTLAPIRNASAEEPAENSAPAATESTSGGSVETAIIGTITDGTPPPPAPEPERLPLEVTSSVVREVHVVESPPMPGLPAPEGDIKITVQLVKDPGLPDPPPPLPALQPDDPAVRARMQEMSTSYQRANLAFVSVTVYDHHRSYFRIYPSGGGLKREICGWSNLDFNHFSGFASFQVKGSDGEVRRYDLMMGISNENTDQMTEWMAQHGRQYQAPSIADLPDLSTAGPAFTVTDGDASDKESMELVQGMHNLYRVEGTRMEEAYHARIKANEERRAFLLAHPPKPKDVTLRFWHRENAAGANQNNQPEVGDENR